MQSKKRSKNADGVSDEDYSRLAEVEEREQAYEEERSRLAGEREKRISGILKNPSRFFTLEYFGDDEINAARTALIGKGWREILVMAFEGEWEKLRSQGRPKDKVDSLVECGWAWKHERALIAFRDKSAFSKLRPKEANACRQMVFVFKAFSWVPSGNLVALVRRELGVIDPTAVGNVSGNYAKMLISIIWEKRAYADFLRQYGDGSLQPEAEGQLSYCDKLLELLDKGGDPSLVSAALNVAWQDSALRVGAEPEMHEGIIKQHAGPRSRKSDESGIRGIIESAYFTASKRKNESATKDEVISELRVSHKLSKELDEDGFHRLGKCKFTEQQLAGWLDDSRERYKALFPKRSKPGRPRKQG